MPAKKTSDEEIDRSRTEAAAGTEPADASLVIRDIGQRMETIKTALDDAQNHPPESLKKAYIDLLKRGEEIVAAGENADPDDLEFFWRGYNDLGLDSAGREFQKVERGIRVGWTRVRELEESRRQFSSPEFVSLLPDDFKRKLDNFRKNLDYLAAALKTLEEKKSAAGKALSGARFSTVETLRPLLDDFDAFKKKMKILEMTFGEAARDVGERRALEERLNKLAAALHGVENFGSDSAEELAFELLKKISEIKIGKIDKLSVEYLEEMAENRIFKKAREYALPSVKEFVKKGLDKTKPDLEFLLDAYTGMILPEAKRKSAIQIAHDLSYELAGDLKNKNIDPKALEIKYREYADNLKLAERQFTGPVEKKAAKERGEKLLQRLLAVKNDAHLDANQRDLVLTWIGKIPQKKSFREILELENTAREYVLDVLEAVKYKEAKAEARARAAIKEEADWFKRGEEKMEAAPAGAKAEVKKTAKEVLTEAGVMEIKPQELLANISEHDAGKLGEYLKKGGAEEAKSLLRDILKEHVSQLAAEQREEVSQQAYEILRAAVLAEANRQMARISKTGVAKNILKNLGIAAGIGIGAGMVIGTGGAAAMVAAGVIAARPILMKQISESEKFKQAKKKIAESKAGSFWGKTFGKWFKKEEPKNDPNAVLAKTVDSMDIKDQLSAVLANQIRENTSRDVRAKIKTYTEAGRTALERPSAEAEDKFAAALDAASYEFYKNALNYVEVTYAGASAEQKKQAALQITLAIGGYERGEVKAAQALKEIQAKAERPEDKYWLVAKMEELTKVRSENLVGAVGIGVVMAGAIRFSSYGRILSGALGGAAVGLSVEKATRERGDVKLEKNIEKMINEAEKKLSGRKVWDIAEADLKKAGDNAVEILSRLDLGLLNNNEILKNRAENFVAFVNRLKMEKADMAKDSLDKILADVGRSSDRLEKLTRKALEKVDKLSGDNIAKRRLIFMLGGAVAGGALSYALGVAASEIRDWWKAPAPVAHDIGSVPAEEHLGAGVSERGAYHYESAPTERPPMTPLRPVPPETPPPAGGVPVEEALGAGKHAVRSIAEIRALRIPENSVDLYNQVGKNAAAEILKLDEGGYHKVAADLYNAVRRVDILEHKADALPAGSSGAIELRHQVEILRGQLTEAEKVLHGGRRADAAEMFRHISRDTLQHEAKAEMPATAVSHPTGTAPAESLKTPVNDDKAVPIEPLSFPDADKDMVVETKPVPEHPVKDFPRHYPRRSMIMPEDSENKPAAKTPVEKIVEPKTEPSKIEEPKLEKPKTETEVKPEETAGAVNPPAGGAKEALQGSLEKQNRAYNEQLEEASRKEAAHVEKTQAEAEEARQAAAAVAEAQAEEAMMEEQLAREAKQAAQAVRVSVAEEWGSRDAVYGSQLIERIQEKTLSPGQEITFEKLVKRFDNALTNRRGGKSLHTIVDSLEKMNK